MKHLFSTVLALLLLLALAAPARADIMWEPQDNQFFKQHGCTYENRSYWANSPEGFVTAWDAPGGSVVQAQYQNGEALWVGYTWQDWALISRWEDGEETAGWVPRAELSLIYDYLSFQEEYADRIKPYNDEFAGYAGDAKVINFYEYPGAPEVKQSFALGDSFGMDILGCLTGSGDGASYIRSIFVDEENRTWGYISYLYGFRNAWFCLDAPDGEGFPARAVAEPEIAVPQTPVLPTRSYVPYILVAAAVVATGGLLAVFYGKRKKA